MVGAQQSLSRYPGVSFPGIPSPCRERLGLWLHFALADTSPVAVPHTEPGAVVGGNELPPWCPLWPQELYVHHI